MYIYTCIIMLKTLGLLFTKHGNNCIDKCSILVMNKVRLIEIIVIRCYFIHQLAICEYLFCSSIVTSGISETYSEVLISRRLSNENKETVLVYIFFK